MITCPIYLRVFPKKQAASTLLSTRWCHGPNLRGITQMVGGRGDDQRFSRRKMWSPLTNHGENDEESGLTLISLSLQSGVWLGTKLFHCKFSVLWSCFLQHKSIPPWGSRKQTNRVQDNGRGNMQNVICVITIGSRPTFFLCSIPPRPRMEISIKVEAQSAVTKGIPRPLHIRSNKQTRKTKDFPRAKVQRMTWSGRMYDKQRFDILSSWKAHIVYIPNV